MEDPGHAPAVPTADIVSCPDGELIYLAVDTYTEDEARDAGVSAGDDEYARVLGRERMILRVLDDASEDDEWMMNMYGVTSVVEHSVSGHGREYWMVALDSLIAEGILLAQTQITAERALELLDEFALQRFRAKKQDDAVDQVLDHPVSTTWT